MPPQSLARTYPNVGISFTPERICERPDAAIWIAQCIANWSWVETQTSRLFSLLLELNVEGATELYNSFGGASLKENAIKVLARSRLAKAHYEIIDALLKVIGSHQKTRDKIAHWYWGISDQITDGLILVDPKDILIRDARYQDKAMRGDRINADDLRMPLDRIYVYKVNDLRDDANAFKELAALINKCHGLCKMQGNRLWKLRDELLRDDRLASRLVRSPSADQ